MALFMWQHGEEAMAKVNFLTDTRQMNLLSILIWTSPLSFLGESGVIFKFY